MIVAVPLVLAAGIWVTSCGILIFPHPYEYSGMFFASLIALIWIWSERRKLGKQLSIITATLFMLGLTLVPIRIAAIESQNSPKGFAAESWQIKSLAVQLTQQLNGNTWIGSIQNLSSSHGQVLVRNAYSSTNFKRGCIAYGDFRVVPSQSSKHPWMLKAQLGIQVNCGHLDFFSSLRGSFMSSLIGVTPDASALVAGLAIGDKTGIASNLGEDMKALSLTHLTAVSGANCAIVIALVILLLRRIALPRFIRTLLSTVALAAYVLLVGFEPSVFRAAVMTGVILLMATSGRGVRPFDALCWAVILLLILDPFFSTELGFVLSVAATAGILLVSPWLYKKLKSKLPGWLAATIAVAVAAQIWCMPFLINMQGGIPTYSVLANVLVEPLVAPVTVLGIVAVVVSAVNLPLAGMLTWLASLPAQLIVTVSHILANLPGGLIWWPTGIYGVALLCLLAVWIGALALSKKRILAMAMLVVVGVGFMASATNATVKAFGWPISNWQIVNCNVGQGDALVVRDSGQIAVVDVGREPKLIDQCLDRLGISSIDLLVLSHFDADHVGGLEGAIENRKVSQIILTEYQDERPQARFLQDRLNSLGAKKIFAHSGISGKLGEISWVVLQPELGAAGSEDSNDGSIAMRWDTSDFSLFTMADLGERGQMRLAQNHLNLLSRIPGKSIVVKVSHHGSADQFFELFEHWQPEVAIISVGKSNSYGHPTNRVLQALGRIGTNVLRTDLDGAISIGVNPVSHQLALQAGG